MIRFHPLLRSSILIISLITSFQARASHIVGAELYYKYISGNTYQVIMTLYGDCGSTTGTFQTLPISTPEVCIYNGSTYYTTTTLSIMPVVCGTEITPLCTGDTSQCTNLSSTIPGVKKFYYSDTITLPSVSANWRLIYTGDNGSSTGSWSCTGTSGSGTGVPSAAGRSSAITNILPGSSIQLIDTLNNSSVDSNSSPVLMVSQQIYFCYNQHDYYNPVAVDPDDDSLHFSIVSATAGTGGCGTIGGGVTYTGNAWTGMPISPAEPLEVLTDSFALNDTNGALTFHPDDYQRAVVLYNIDEYRHGVFVGSSQREMTVLVVDCATTFPCMVTSSTETSSVTGKMYAELYPNPASDELTMKISQGAYSSYTIANTVGQTIENSLISSVKTIDVSYFPPGIYYVTFYGDNGTVVKKFVKR